MLALEVRVSFRDDAFARWKAVPLGARGGFGEADSRGRDGNSGAWIVRGTACLIVLLLLGCSSPTRDPAGGAAGEGGSGRGAPVLEALRQRVERDFLIISTAAELFRIETGRWPDTLDELTSGPTTDEGELPPYLLSAPVDPWTGSAYEWETTDSGFRLISRGADGQIGGDGGAADIVREFRGSRAASSDETK